MNIAFDTNLLAYAEGIDSSDQQTAAIEVIARLLTRHVVIPCQVLGELFNVLIRKGNRTREQARNIILNWCDEYRIAPTTSEALLTAVEVAKDHNLQIWDAVILAVAAHSGCRLLLSEDMHDGFTWNGVTVVNPFAKELHPLLQSLLQAQH